MNEERRDVKRYAAMAITIVLFACLIAIVVIWSANRTNPVGPTVAVGGTPGAGASIAGWNQLTPVVPTISAINCVDSSINCANAGSGVLALSVPTPTPAPTATPQPTATPGAAVANRNNNIPLSIAVTPTAMAVHGIPNVIGQTTGAYFLDSQDTHYYPFVVEQAITVFQIGFERSGGGGDSNCRVGIYDVIGHWQPDNLIVDGGQIVVSSGGVDGWWWNNVNVSIDPGSYVTALYCEAGMGVGAIYGSSSITFMQEDTSSFSNVAWNWNVNTPSIANSATPFPATGDKWNDYDLGASSAFFPHVVMLKYTVN